MEETFAYVPVGPHTNSVHSLSHLYLLSPQLAPTQSPSLVNSMKLIENPVHTCDKVYTLIQSLTSQIRKRLEDPKSAGTLGPPCVVFILYMSSLNRLISNVHEDYVMYVKSDA